LLQYSQSFSEAWQEAVATAKLRNELTAKINEDGPFLSFFRVATRGDLPGYKTPAVASAAEGIDALINTPSWLVPVPRAELDKADSWNRNCEHNFNPARTEDDLSNSFGVDLRGGSTRDWNEELQVAREMPTDDIGQRIDRARLLNKVLSDFGEAAIQGVKAIDEGQVSSMNPNEPARSQVFLHNNIFFSRAIDGGVETFKISRGDRAARKAASRDLSCLGVLHRMERTDIHTLATVLVDYMGIRYVCQSILPGILSGEKTHTLLYGTVEAGLPLVWDKNMHEILEKSIGRSLLIASRPIPRDPLTEGRAAEVNAAKIASPHYVELKAKKTEQDEEGGLSPTVNICAPIEMKGIRGSDQRMYVLDVTRLTPRDANWIPKDKGGTGRWEGVEKKDNGESKIPVALDDDEWTVAVLRSELVTSFAQMKMGQFIKDKRDEHIKDFEKEEKSQKKSDEPPATVEITGSVDADKNEAVDKELESKEKADLQRKNLEAEKLEYLKNLRFNINVFLPDMKSLEGIDDEAHKQILKDEEMVREAAEHLWDEILPGLTAEVRQGAMQNIPHDGKSLTELIHQRGINCRYMGRLASLALVEEAKDRKEDEILKGGGAIKLERRRMPIFWLELLECEMVARAAKHVLNRYLNSDGANVARSPAQTIASLLSALVSEREESAAQTEIRTETAAKEGAPDEEDFNKLTFYRAAGGGGVDATPCRVRDRFEVWKDIEEEIGRRFRYTLTLFNRPGKDDGRAIYAPLLRRICQRIGVRLVARSYDLGGSSYCGAGSSGFQIAASHPISALDIVDVVPLMKHSAAHGEGFISCGASPALGLPPLHISLLDARAAIESAHIHHSNKSLSRALDLAQEAAALYQRVTDNPAHPGIVRCMDLMATILFDAGEPELAAANGARALGLMVQVNGFDSPDVINLHFILFQFYVSCQNFTKAIKHIRAAIYLMDLVGGPHHFELSNAYHKCGSVYHGLGDVKSATMCFDEAANRVSSDRFLEGVIYKSSAGMHAAQEDFKVAVAKEKRAFQIFSVLLGPNHEFTKQSDVALKRLMKAAVEQGSKMAKVKNIKEEEAVAAAIANQIVAEEQAKDEEQRRKNKNGQKKKNSKSKK
jgi:protein TIF31